MKPRGLYPAFVMFALALALLIVAVGDGSPDNKPLCSPCGLPPCKEMRP